MKAFDSLCDFITYGDRSLPMFEHDLKERIREAREEYDELTDRRVCVECDDEAIYCSEDCAKGGY